MKSFNRLKSNQKKHETNSRINKFYFHSRRLLVVAMLAVTSLAACDRDFKKPQLTDSTTKGAYPSVGNMTDDKNTGSNQKDLIATGAKPNNSAAQGVLPKDGNGEVGSTMASTINPSMLNAAPNEQIDVSRYSYNDRKEFKAFMGSRITAIDRGLKDMKSQEGSRKDSAHMATGVQQNFKDLETKENRVASELNKVDSVARANWDQFKVSFRDEVVGLERSYQMISTARR